MALRSTSILNPKKRYLQVALNNTLEEAGQIISKLPVSNQIVLEAGTPFIKRYGEAGIRQIRAWQEARIALSGEKDISPYIVADLKTMDRGETEVELAARAGASAAIALGEAPLETLNTFIAACEAHQIDSMVDMMNTEFPLGILRKLHKVPTVVILHRGVDEERDNREKMLPLYEIRRIKGAYNLMISVAGGDTLREVQSAVFNDADIVVVWKSVYKLTDNTIELVTGFLKAIK